MCDTHRQLVMAVFDGTPSIETNSIPLIGSLIFIKMAVMFYIYRVRSRGRRRTSLTRWA
ncbi:TPA_asm: P6 [Pelargonium alphacytorhabdovirus 1]|nr:TPA_asm: P6 [Pelargonium alphacytorhabdovirus 1]